MEGEFAQTQFSHTKAPGMAPGRLACHSAVPLQVRFARGNTRRLCKVGDRRLSRQLDWLREAVIQET